MPEMRPADTPSFEGYVTSAPSSKNRGVVAPRKVDAAQNSTKREVPEDGMRAGVSPMGWEIV